MGVAFADSVVGGLAIHFVLCVIAFLCGCGVLKILRLEMTASSALFAPFLTLVFWTLGLGIGVGSRLTVQFIAPWIWGATLALMGFGLPPARSVVQSSWQLLLTAVLLPVIVMWASFWNGAASYSCELLPDGWAYVAAGQYFWKYSRGAEGGLAELYQYASCLSESRYITSSLLGMMSPFVRAGDAQAVASFVQSLAIFISTSSVACFWLSTTGKKRVAIWGSIGFAASGWIANVLIANNYDNLLALSYMPALAAAWRVAHGRRLAWALIMGCGVAAVTFTYIELAMAIVGCATIICLPVLLVNRSEWRMNAGAVILATLISGALLLPFSDQLKNFIQQQMQLASANDNRPGEGFFPGLKKYSNQPAAFWGLGSEHGDEPRVTNNTVGWLLSACAFVGVLVLLYDPTTRSLAFVFLLVNAIAIYMIFGKHYSYGAYKFILLGWWLSIGIVVCGLEEIVSHLKKSYVRQWAVRVYVIATIVLIAFTLHSHINKCDQYLATPYRSLSLRPFRELNNIGAITSGSTVLVCLNDWFACEWAANFLRDMPTTFTHYSGYMEWPIHTLLMQRSREANPCEARFVLSDHQPDFLPKSATPRWVSGPFQLWELANPIPAFLTNVTAPGKCSVRGRSAYDLGTQYTAFEVLATKHTTMRLAVDVMPLPCQEANGSAWIEASMPNSKSRLIPIAPGRHAIDLVVQPGRNRLRLRVRCGNADETPQQGEINGASLVSLSNLDISIVEASGSDVDSEVRAAGQFHNRTN